MTLLDPRRHVAVHFGTAPPTVRPALTVAPDAAPAPAPITSHTLMHGAGRIEANAGGGVCILRGATRAQLLELRAHLDAAIAAAVAGEESAA